MYACVYFICCVQSVVTMPTRFQLSMSAISSRLLPPVLGCVLIKPRGVVSQQWESPADSYFSMLSIMNTIIMQTLEIAYTFVQTVVTIINALDHRKHTPAQTSLQDLRQPFCMLVARDKPIYRLYALLRLIVRPIASWNGTGFCFLLFSGQGVVYILERSLVVIAIIMTSFPRAMS